MAKVGAVFTASAKEARSLASKHAKEAIRQRRLQPVFRPGEKVGDNLYRKFVVLAVWFLERRAELENEIADGYEHASDPPEDCDCRICKLLADFDRPAPFWMITQSSNGWSRPPETREEKIYRDSAGNRIVVSRDCLILGDCPVCGASDKEQCSEPDVDRDGLGTELGIWIHPERLEAEEEGQ